MESKKCGKCKQIKPFSDFFRSNGHKYAYCKSCCDIRRKSNPEYYRQAARKYYRSHRAKIRQQGQDLKLKVLKHYSQGQPKCQCCGESHVEFLSIDHINGGGKKHRKSIKVTGSAGFYLWLIKNNYPPEFRVLCMNCNFARGMFGHCPHEGHVQTSTASFVANNDKNVECQPCL